MGQPITLAKRMILGPAATWRYYAGFAGKLAGESYPPDEDGTYKIVQYEPLGKLVLASLWLMNRTRIELALTFTCLYRCLRGYLCLERLACDCGLEDGAGDGGGEYVCAEV